MIKVRFITTSAGAGGIIRPGDVVEVSESEAKILTTHGFAEIVEPTVKTPKTEPKPTSTASKPTSQKKKTVAKKES